MCFKLSITLSIANRIWTRGAGLPDIHLDDWLRLARCQPRCVPRLRRELARAEPRLSIPHRTSVEAARAARRERMIKSVVVPRLVAQKDELDQIHAVLTELGFQTG